MSLAVEVDNDAMLPLVDVDNEVRPFAVEADNDAMSLAVEVDSEFSCDMLTASVEPIPAATPLSNTPSVAFDIVNTLPFAPPARK
ncbi:hypothetical protein WI98_05175 [Burkholderia vietnamiensis]|nr:hypothetical protein WI94_27980 [Burkholderia vietnamiensis]KVE77948.1 hypothetical protein WI98_05175 [Burkholderia vietnamiensis]KVE96432.1 hypothetical protein WJ01_10390 [Burkholderia vietnamiensis]